jgi:acetyl esterase/lipase
VKSVLKVILIGISIIFVSAGSYLLLTDQPMVKLMRYIAFNSFEFEGEEIGNIEKDIIYKTVDGEELMVDIYYPLVNKFESAPVVVFSHGGGWITGDRSTMFTGPDNEGLIIRLREQGYAIANFEYRVLSESTNLTDMIADNKDIVRWLRLNADQHSLDPENIGLWGQSAGGHLVLMAGLSDDDAFTDDPSLSHTFARVNYIVNNYGISDLSELFRPFILKEESPGSMQQSQFEFMFGTNVSIDSEEFIEQSKYHSPVSHIDPDDPPIISLHGDSDTLVPPAQSQILYQALEVSGNLHELNVIEDVDHVFNGATTEQFEEIINLSLSFITRHTKIN